VIGERKKVKKCSGGCGVSDIIKIDKKSEMRKKQGRDTWVHQ